MELRIVEDGGIEAIEGEAGSPFMVGLEDLDRLVEACFASDARSAVLYAANLPTAFFDLRTGCAGAMLQKLRNYDIRLAVIADPGQVRETSRFVEMVAEERQSRHFGWFETREAARIWLADS